MKKIWFFIGITGLILLALVILYFQSSTSQQISIVQTSTPPEQRDTITKSSSIIAPVAEFQQRITKKPFGIFITPKSSPVQPERFTGYHTGVDVEYGDVQGDVIVSAIADGTVVLSKRATGYGGVIAIEHTISDKRIIAIYGHLDPKSLPTVGTSVKMGNKIGILGDGETQETDGERKHLHFGLSISLGVDIRGYVQQKEELAGWLNPVEVLGFE